MQEEESVCISISETETAEKKTRESFLHSLASCPPDSYTTLDTETGSLKGPVIQIGIVLSNKNGETLASYSCLWKYKYSRYQKKMGGLGEWCERAQAVHGLTKELIDDNGVTPSFGVRALKEILNAVKERKIAVVAHNANFDARMINSTSNALQMGNIISDENMFCTLKWSKQKYGTRKTNEELYLELHGVPHDLTNLHDAITDATITASSYAMIMAGLRDT